MLAAMRALAETVWGWTHVLKAGLVAGGVLLAAGPFVVAVLMGGSMESAMWLFLVALVGAGVLSLRGPRWLAAVFVVAAAAPLYEEVRILAAVGLAALALSLAMPTWRRLDGPTAPPRPGRSLI